MTTMILDWHDDYVDQKVAVTKHGTYRVDDSDSLGRREITFTNDDGSHFIGTCMLSEDGVAMAEKHAAWVSTFESKEQKND